MLIPAAAEDFSVLFSLLEASFPKDEYRPYPSQLALLERKEYTLYTTADRGALLSLWHFPGFVFLEHFAVSPQLRGRGYGEAILKSVLSTISEPVILEAELPLDAISSRRIRFYQRMGFFVNPFPYRQPAYAPGQNSVPMHLLSTKPLTIDDFQTYRKIIYEEVYQMKGRG